MRGHRHTHIPPRAREQKGPIDRALALSPACNPSPLARLLSAQPSLRAMLDADQRCGSGSSWEGERGSGGHGPGGEPPLVTLTVPEVPTCSGRGRGGGGRAGFQGLTPVLPGGCGSVSWGCWYSLQLQGHCLLGSCCVSAAGPPAGASLPLCLVPTGKPARQQEEDPGTVGWAVIWDGCVPTSSAVGEQEGPSSPAWLRGSRRVTANGPVSASELFSDEFSAEQFAMERHVFAVVSEKAEKHSGRGPGVLTSSRGGSGAAAMCQAHRVLLQSTTLRSDVSLRSCTLALHRRGSESVSPP